MKKSLLIVLLSIAACTSAPKAADEGSKLTAIISRYTEAVKRLDPYWSPYFNLEEDFNKFGDYLSPEFFERDKALLRKTLGELKGVDVAKLSSENAIAYKLFKSTVEKDLKSYEFPWELLEFNQMNNRIHTYIDSANPDLTDFPFKSVKNYDAYVERSKGFAPFIDRLIATLKRGVKEKVTQSCIVTAKAVNTYKSALEPSPDKNPFFKPALKFPESFSAADRKRLANDFRNMVSENILPPLRRFDDYFRNDYSKHCRKEFGIGSLPNGKEWYAFRVAASSDSDLDANTIHEIGLKEVKRIESEIAAIQKKLGYKGSVKDFLKKLAKDKNSYFQSRHEMLEAFAKMKGTIAEKIPRYFSLVPKGDYTIKESTNPEDASGSYRVPTEINPIGRFILNTSDLKLVPKYSVTTLLMHEAIPGHHFQFALKIKKKNRLSEFQRKLFNSTAFVEGWALYAEYLGREMDLYDDYQKLGNLMGEQMRAVRLVVDTGIHSKGWDQKRTMAFMREHLSNDERDNEIEANRYSVWPGQALAYKIGQLKILELRKLAEKELGPKFDIRQFHRVVIGDGTLSLKVLEEKVHEWIKSVQG